MTISTDEDGFEFTLVTVRDPRCIIDDTSSNLSDPDSLIERAKALVIT